MKRILLTITMVLISVGAVAQNFDAYFSDNTIRLDYTLIGNAKEQKIALDEVISIMEQAEKSGKNTVRLHRCHNIY